MYLYHIIGIIILNIVIYVRNERLFTFYQGRNIWFNFEYHRTKESLAIILHLKHK